MCLQTPMFLHIAVRVWGLLLIYTHKTVRFYVKTAINARELQITNTWKNIPRFDRLNVQAKSPAHHDDVIKWKHFPRYWPFVRGIHRGPVNSPHKGQWRGALMFSLICVWINGWVNNREAGDLRRYHAHYDVTVMCSKPGGNTVHKVELIDLEVWLNIRVQNWSPWWVCLVRCPQWLQRHFTIYNGGTGSATAFHDMFSHYFYVTTWNISPPPPRTVFWLCNFNSFFQSDWYSFVLSYQPSICIFITSHKC